MTTGDNLATHVILTRFNLPSIGYESYIRDDERWLQRRVVLFERFCLPSIRDQTDQDFTWIIYFDPDSPDWLLGKIDIWKRHKQLRPVFRRDVSLAEKREDVAMQVGIPFPRLITTNLDNDDALASDFIARIKRVPSLSPRCAIFIENGLVLHRNELFIHRDPHNAFCSVSEAWENPITCWAHSHDQLADHMPTISIGGPPGWMQVIHDDNVSNRIKGRRTAPAPFLSDFVALDHAVAPTIGDRINDVMVTALGRMVLENVRWACKQTVIMTLGRSGLDPVRIFWHKQKRRFSRFFQ